MESENIKFSIAIAIALIIGAMLGRSTPINNNSKAENNVTINQEIPENSGNFRKFQENSEKKVDLNNADYATIISLKGIGKKKANEIIERRNKEKFTSIHQLLEEGILGPESFLNNKDILFVGD